jgi:plasmid stabilization system protein ParE
MLFNEELDRTLLLIAEIPGAGVACPTRRRPGPRRILMRRTSHYLYFEVDEEKGLVSVLTVWGAARGAEPKL